MKVHSILALAVVALAIAACGGGGGGGGSTPASVAVVPGAAATATASPVPAATAASTAGATATLKVTLPAATTGSSAARRIQNIAPGSTSLSVQLIEAGGVTVSNSAPQTFAILATSPGCSQTAGVITCILQIAAPVGSDVFLAQTYSSSGALLSTGALNVTIALNSVNNASLALDGTIASVYVTALSPGLGAVGANFVASTRVFVIALDNQGNTILNPTVFNTPITLQQTFTSGYTPDVTLSVQSATNGTTTTTSTNYGTVSVTSPDDVITATLQGSVTNGSPYATIAGYIGATSVASPNPVPSGIPQLSLAVNIPAALTVGSNPWSILGLGATYNYIYGGLGTYSLAAPSCSGIVTLAVQSNYYISAAPIAVGSCSATLTDTHGDSLTIPITVTTTTVTGS